MAVATKKWTIIILANLENDSFLKIEDLYKEAADGIAGFRAGKGGVRKEDVNFVLIADKHRVKVHSSLSEKYAKYGMDEYRFVDIYQIKAGTGYYTSRPAYIERKFRRDNFYRPGNIRFYMRLIQKKFPAQRYGFIYKSHGGNNTDFFGKFVESLLFRPTGSLYNELAKFWNEETKAEANVDLIEKEIAKLWGKKHSHRFWAFEDPYQVDEDKNGKTVAALATYRGKVWGRSELELKYKSLADALKDVFGHKGVSFILFDCCWGLRYEMAGLFENVTPYVIGSADESPLVGIGYDIWTKRLLEFPDMRNEEVAKMLVPQFYISRFNDYIDQDLADPSKGPFYKYGISMTCLDMAKYQQTAVLFSNLVDSLIFLLSEKNKRISNAVTNAVFKARAKCKDYTYTLPADAYPVFNIDFIWFLRNLKFQVGEVLTVASRNYKAICEGVIKVCDDLIVGIKLDLMCAFCHNNYEQPRLLNRKKYIGGYGISITFPSSEDLFKQEGSNLTDFKNFPEYRMTRWTEFLILFFDKVEEYNIE